jgi:DNA modification methylase
MFIRKDGYNMASQSLTIENLTVASLKLDPQNPRLHDRKQIRQLANSIKTFGFNVPVLVDPELRVIAGHGRVLACKQLGIAQIPVIRLEHLSENQARAFMIADNKLTENAEWDSRLLSDQFRVLSEAEIDFSLEVTGFEMSEIDTFVEGATPTGHDKEDPADSIPDSGPKPQVSRAGDCWLLGRHRVLCGDARKDSAFSLLMKGHRAGMVFTDPPYNDPIDGYVTGFGKIHHPEFALASGEMSATEFTEFLGTVLAHLARNSVNGALHFICMDWRHAPELISAARSTYAEFKNLCVWVKDCGGQGSLYRSQHELVFVFKNGRKAHRNNIQLGQYGRYRTNVWQYRRVNSLSRSNDEGNLSALHPTIKPVEMVADAILDCTARRQIVLDAFLGSGTTVIAAERTGRACYGLELDVRYVDTIVRRWQAFTGQSAVQESTGQTFDQIEEAMHG